MKKLLLANLLFASTLHGEAQLKPNILLIAVDDMNNYVGCMGGPAQTPNIDALANKGMLFNNAYCATPACNPSRVAIMTGLRPETTGQYTNKGNFRERGNNQSLITIQQKLMAAGYKTLEAGKIFHVPRGTGMQPAPQSDPVSWNYQHASNTGTTIPRDKYLTQAGVAKWLQEDTLPYTNGKAVDYLARASIWGPNQQKKEETGDWKMSQFFADFVKQNHDQPFFFCLGISKPHQPLIAPKEYFDKYPLETLNIPPWSEDDMKDIPDIAQTNFSSEMVVKIRRKQQLKKACQAYLAAMSFADDCVGNAIKALEKSAYASNTIVVFFTDHGFQLGDKNRWEKYSLWKEATNSPLIISYPQMKNKGTVCSEAVSLMDIHPTLLQLAGLPVDKELQCTSLTPQLQHPKAGRELPAVVTHEQGNYAIVWKQWNYIRYGDGSEELYNHQTDNAEFHNMASDKKYSAIKKQLANYFPEVKVLQAKKTVAAE